MSTRTRILALLARRPAFGAPLVALARPVTKVGAVLTGPDAIAAALGDPEVEVPYRDRSIVLGVGDFPLALDGEAHGHANARIARVLAESGGAAAAGVVAAETLAAELLGALAPGDELDVVAGLIDPVLQRWAEVWFGLPGEGARLADVGRSTMHAMFLNPMLPAGRVDDDALTACKRRIDDARAAWGPMLATAGDGTVARVLAASGSPSPEPATADLVGLTVGPLALGSRSLAVAVDELLVRGRQDAVTDAAAARDALEAALAVRAPLPALPRIATVPLHRGIGARVPVGTFLAATAVAAAAPDEDPARWAFGVGPHACLGRHLIGAVAAAVLVPLSARRPRRLDGEAGRLVPSQPADRPARWPADALRIRLGA